MQVQKKTLKAARKRRYQQLVADGYLPGKHHKARSLRAKHRIQKRKGKR